MEGTQLCCSYTIRSCFPVSLKFSFVLIALLFRAGVIALWKRQWKCRWTAGVDVWVKELPWKILTTECSYLNASLFGC